MPIKGRILGFLCLGLSLLLQGQVKADTNELLDADILIFVTDNSTFTAVGAEGYLHLIPHGPAGSYVGTFRDNLAAGQTFAASGTSVSGTSPEGAYVIHTGNGRFSVTIATGTNSYTVPAKYGTAATIKFMESGPHAYTENPPLSVKLDGFITGPFLPVIAGTLKLTTDYFAYIVPANEKEFIDSSFTYNLKGHTHRYLLNSYGQYTPPDGKGNGALTAVLKIGSFAFNIENAKEDTGGQKTIGGNAYSGSGRSTLETSFSAK